METLHTWNRERGLIFTTLAGSRLYGTDRPESDLDIRGVCFASPNAILGLQGFEQFQPNGETALAWSKSNDFPESNDVTIYGLDKFFSLCLNANPNILELLFVPRRMILYSSWCWHAILQNREMFLSTKIVHTFAGYAYSQLSRIQRHYKWINDPPDKPDPYNFGLYDKIGGSSAWVFKNQKQEYEKKQKEWAHYKTWRENRNPARAKLEDAHGYDTKHAMHLYRLILEATELLKTGHLTLPLQPDTQEFLLSVLRGYIPYDEVVQMGEEAKDMLMSLEKDSPLPHGADYEGAEELLVSLNWEWLQWNSRNSEGSYLNAGYRSVGGK